MTSRWPGMPGGIELGYGLAELEREEEIAKRGVSDPHPDRCFAGHGVLPGRVWRRYSAEQTGLERAPTKLLDSWRHWVVARPKGRPWSERDHAYKAEILARSIDLETAYTWHNGSTSQAWFDGLVPCRLKPIVGLLWAAYYRHTYGVAEIQPKLAAKFDVTRKTIRNWVTAGSELGLVRSERLWRATEGDREWDMCLLRIGPLVEVLGGVAAFERRRPRGVSMRVAWPGAVPRVVVTQDLARERAAALREASKRATFEAAGEAYADRAKVAAGPELFLRYLADVLDGAPRPVPAWLPAEDQQEPAELAEPEADDLGEATPETGPIPVTIPVATERGEANITASESDRWSDPPADLQAAARAGNAFAEEFLALNAAANRRKRKKVPSTPALLPPINGGEGELSGEPGGLPSNSKPPKKESRSAPSPSSASQALPTASATDRGDRSLRGGARPSASPTAAKRPRSVALGGGLEGTRHDAATEVIRAVGELADSNLAERLAAALPRSTPRVSPEERRQALAEIAELKRLAEELGPDPWPEAPTAEEYLAARRSKGRTPNEEAPP